MSDHKSPSKLKRVLKSLFWFELATDSFVLWHLLKPTKPRDKPDPVKQSINSVLVRLGVDPNGLMSGNPLPGASDAARALAVQLANLGMKDAANQLLNYADQADAKTSLAVAS